ncbi:unnamed protein product [Sphenostylis stenocarpa]|uniref:TIR domain-containing protein n=1 Tax=Sphenostylis stenocarpa TaxID=92480 RepID=A0AA86SXN2_9FABA|nr:unnamed protein product [Sphenostylis stenocarpa]
MVLPAISTKALHDRGIHTFVDDEELQGGEEITPALVKAIEESRIAIPCATRNSMIKLQGKKVLLILDDVDEHWHIQAIGERPYWFSVGV